MNGKFPKCQRLLSRSDFLRVSKGPHRKVFVGQFVIIEAIQSQLGYCRIGITATKRYGNAVARNRFKRIIRESFRILQFENSVSLDFVIKARFECKPLTLVAMKKELSHLLGRYVSKNSIRGTQQCSKKSCGDDTRSLVNISGCR